MPARCSAKVNAAAVTPDRLTRDFPLFPLGLVTLPTEYVPLHIFEERYKQMVGECLERETEFGILWMADDIPGVEVARRTGYSVVQISRIRTRFAQHRIAGLQERVRSGRPKKVTEKMIARVVALTLRAPPAGVSHWSARDLAAKTGLSHMTVHRIWKDHGLKPHRLETFKFSTDPEAESKIRDIVGLYLNPPDNAAVLCLDEKTQIQALERTQPLLPLRENLPARQTHDYRRNGLTSLYAALEIARGRVIGERGPRNAEYPSVQLPHVSHRGAVPRQAQEDLLRHVVGIHAGRHAAAQEGTQRLDEGKPARVVGWGDRIGGNGHRAPCKTPHSGDGRKRWFACPSAAVSFERVTASLPA